MAHIAYNEILPRKYIVLEGEPYEVLTSQITKKNRQKPSNQTKVKSLITGKVTDRAFHQSDTVVEADISTKKIKYLYMRCLPAPARPAGGGRQEFWFCEENDPRKRFALLEDQIGTQGTFLKQNALVDALLFESEIIGIKIPIKVDLVVKEAPPAVRGNTAQGATKQIVLESGAQIHVPLFINEGDVVRINTETGQYVERAEKK